MPFMTNGKRDYKKEANWEKTKKPSRIKDRRDRMSNRRAAEKDGRVTKGDGKHLDHKKALTSGGARTAKSNLRVTSAKANVKKEGQRKSRAAK